VAVASMGALVGQHDVELGVGEALAQPARDCDGAARTRKGVGEHLGRFDDAIRAALGATHALMGHQDSDDACDPNDGKQHGGRTNRGAQYWLVGKEVNRPVRERAAYSEMCEPTEGEDPERRHRGDEHRDQKNGIEPRRRSGSETVEGATAEQCSRQRDQQRECDEMNHSLSLSSAAKLAASAGSSPLANPASADARSLVASSSEWILRAVNSASVSDAR